MTDLRHVTHHAPRAGASKARPQNSDGRVGAWTRKQLLQMDRRFLQRHAQSHRAATPTAVSR